jgi:predicted MPP superfamily phosphohydrolase
MPRPRLTVRKFQVIRWVSLGAFGASRVTLFRGIDVHQFLPRLADALVPTKFGVPKRATDMEATREAALSRLLAAMFSSEDLLRWVHLTFGRSVAAQLPGYGTSLSQLVFVLTLVLQRHGLIDARLFKSLVAERPARLADIATIARQWNLDLYDDTSLSLRARMTPESMPALRLTGLFSPTDQIFWDKLMGHLGPLSHRGELSRAQGMGLPASRHKDFLTLTSFLRSATEDANIVVFLVSADFLGSDYAAPAVLEAALDRAASHQVAVLTVIVRPCLWTESWFSGFPVLPRGGSTMTTAPNEDEAWLEVVQAISVIMRTPRAATGDTAERTAAVALDVSIADDFAPVDVVTASEVFGTTRMPTHTLVETRQFEDLRYEMTVPRRLLVVEGPSGIGKTVAVKHVANAVNRDGRRAWPLVRLNAKEPADLKKIDELLQQPVTALRGYTIIDEFHNLNTTRKHRLASCAKVLADQDDQEAKLIFVGIPRVRESILADVPDLNGRMIVVRLGRVDVAYIEKLIEKGEQALNVSFMHKANLAVASEGSFVIAQQLCESAMVKAHVLTTALQRTTLHLDLRDLRPALLDGLHAQFYASLQAFSMQSGAGLVRGAAIALLWHLRESDDGSLQIAYVRARYPDLDSEFAVLLQRLSDTAHVDGARWRQLFYCDPAGGQIALEDPKLHFYLKHLNWEQLGRDCGVVLRVIVDSGNLMFPATSGRPLGQAAVAAAPSHHPPTAAGRQDAARQNLLVRVLHLSDFHFNARTSWDSGTVLGRLAVDIHGLVREGLAPDLIVVTGDIAQSGKPEEYDLARTWILRELLPAAGVDVTRLLVVPGNHDVDRNLVGRSAQHLADGIREARNQNDVAEVLGGEGRDLLLRRLDAYVAFLNSLGVIQPPLERPWYRTTHDIRGVRVHCAALASAWLSADDQDYGQLLLGLWQCNEVLYGADDAHVVIAAMHHPWDYFAEWDRVATQAEIERSAGLVLRGHLHDARYQHGQSPRHGGVLELAAGACYETSQVANSYHLIEIPPAPSGEHRVRIHPRRWEPARREWRPDLNVFGGPFGELPVRMRSITEH